VIRVNKKVCFISGAGHSGSTLLGLILGSHSDSFYAGEARKTMLLQNKNSPESKRVCKICGPTCPIWQDFTVESHDLYEQLSIKTGKSLIIDSTKNSDWLNTQIETLRQTSAQSWLIFLQRDGRAVINSRLRKYPTQEAKRLINDWLEQIELTEQLFANFDGPKIKIHYEELATEPTCITQKLCNFLEIPYQSTMLNYYHHAHHPLGGNSGTQFLVVKSQHDRLKQPYLQLAAQHEAYYQNHPPEIRLDLRWKQELSPTVRTLFEEMGGAINEAFKF